MGEADRSVQGVRGCHEVWAVKPNPPVPSILGGRYQLVEHGTARSSASMGGVDPHALDLGCLRANPLQCGRSHRNIILERQQEPSVRRLELGNGTEIVLNGLLDRQPEAIPRFEPIVAPHKVVEPKTHYCLSIPRQVGFPDLGHT